MTITAEAIEQATPGMVIDLRGHYVQSDTLTIPAGVTLRGGHIDARYFDIFGTLQQTKVTSIASNPARRSSDDAGKGNVLNLRPGGTLLDCWITDIVGIVWMESESDAGGRIEGCLIQHIGGFEASGGLAYHGIYTHNHSGGKRVIKNNVWMNCLRGYQIHAYSAGANHVRDYDIVGNIFVSNQQFIRSKGGDTFDILFEDNVILMPNNVTLPDAETIRGEGNIQWGGSIEGMVASNVGVTRISSQAPGTFWRGRWLVYRRLTRDEVISVPTSYADGTRLTARPVDNFAHVIETTAQDGQIVLPVFGWEPVGAAGIEQVGTTLRPAVCIYAIEEV